MNEPTTPCADPANNPDDWFIEKDGLRHLDDVLVTRELQIELSLQVEERMPSPSLSEHDANELSTAINGVLADAEADELKARLRLRRHARDKCFVECSNKARLACLDLALDGNEQHGTWGGYFSEHLQKIRRLRDEREQRVGAPE